MIPTRKLTEEFHIGLQELDTQILFKNNNYGQLEIFLWIYLPTAD